MDVGHGECGLFDAFGIYDRARPFFRGRDAYSYASGFAAAMEGMGYRIEWCHEEGTTRGSMPSPARSGMRTGTCAPSA